MKNKEEILFELHKKYDKKTAMHEKRVAELAYKVAEKISTSKELLTNIYYAGLLHDIGKMFIPLSILKNNNPLSHNEIKILKDHSAEGAEFLEKQGFNERIVKGVRDHHERLDGSGYPLGLMNEEISMEGKIIAICDTYDAMSSPRPYRKKLYSNEEIFKKMLKGTSVLFDPYILELLEKVIEEDNYEKEKVFLYG